MGRGFEKNIILVFDSAVQNVLSWDMRKEWKAPKDFALVLGFATISLFISY